MNICMKMISTVLLWRNEDRVTKIKQQSPTSRKENLRQLSSPLFDLVFQVDKMFLTDTLDYYNGEMFTICLLLY